MIKLGNTLFLFIILSTTSMFMGRTLAVKLKTIKGAVSGVLKSTFDPLNKRKNCISGNLNSSSCLKCHHYPLIQAICVDSQSFSVKNCLIYDKDGCIECEQGFLLQKKLGYCQQVQNPIKNCLKHKIHQVLSIRCSICKAGFVNN